MSKQEPIWVSGIGIVDADGVVVETDEEAGADNLALERLLDDALRSAEQEKRWGDDAKMRRLLAKKAMEAREVKHFNSPRANATRVDNQGRRVADTAAMFEWLNAHEIDDLSLIEQLIGKLNPKAVEIFFEAWGEDFDDPDDIAQHREQEAAIISWENPYSYVKVTRQRELYPEFRDVMGETEG